MAAQLLCRLCPIGFVLLTLSTVATSSQAQPFPSSVIRIVVSAAAGTPPDIISRVVANELAQSEGWRMVVENKVGAMQLPQAIADLLNGTNHYQFVTTLPVIDLIATGKLRALAMAAPKRVLALQNVPTVVEEGFPELVVQDWNGYLVRSSTTNSIVVRLNEAINKALGKPEVKVALEKLGAEAAGGSPAEFGDFMNSQLAYWGKVVKDSGIKMQQ
jgi:tripartite-type tricarboxylate transporter receptor subunit TctC